MIHYEEARYVKCTHPFTFMLSCGAWSALPYDDMMETAELLSVAKSLSSASWCVCAGK